MSSLGKLILFVAAGLILTLMVACSVKPTTGLTVLAPDYLQGIMKRAGEQFELETGIPVRFIYDGGHNIVERAGREARVDVLLSNNLKRFTNLKDDSLIMRHTIACPFSLSLLLVGHNRNIHLEKPEELLDGRFRRIVIINPESGYEGPLGQSALKRCGLWDKVKGKTILAGDSDHLLTYLISGEAEAGIVLEISLVGYRGFTPLLNLDEFVGEHLRHCGAIKSDSRYPESGQAFLDFLASGECAIYKIRGIRPGG